MDEEPEGKSATLSHPPPPCDPFQRYQTPWPRYGQDDENPFIRFRRFADSQFKAFFSGVPFVKHSFDEHFESLAAQHRKEMDAAIKEMIENHRQLVRDIDLLRPPKQSEAIAVIANAEKSSHHNPKMAEYAASSEPATELDMYERPRVEELDPFANKDDTYPWLLASQYSPVWLSVQLKPRPEAIPEISSMGSSYLNAVRLNTDSENDLSKFAWKSAFEDLLALERTGQLPEPRPDHPWPEHPGVWLAGLFRRRLLTLRPDLTSHRATLVTFWDPLVSAFGTAELDRQLTSILRDHAKLPVDNRDNEDYMDYEDGDEDEDEDEQHDASTTPVVTAEMVGKPLARTLAHAFHAVEKTVEDVMGLALRSSDSETSALPSQDSWPSIVSTMTRIETCTLPDGSTETRRVLRRRFADGREEHEESVETGRTARQTLPPNNDNITIPAFSTADKQTPTHLPSETAQESNSSGKSQAQSRGGGWFWR